MQSLIASIRISVATMVICVAGYTALMLAFAQTVTPRTANGSLITNADSTVIGSRLEAQAFTQPRYFWPRPSAVDYDGAGAGGSNKSPTSPDLTDRAREIVTTYGATTDNPLPADLVAASGSGLDPTISVAGALYQVSRIAAARHMSEDDVRALVEQSAYSPGGILASGRVVNVLLLNLRLDARQQTSEG